MKLVLWGIIVLGITAYLVWSSEREEEKEELNRHHAWVKRESGPSLLTEYRTPRRDLVNDGFFSPLTYGMTVECASTTLEIRVPSQSC